MNKKIHKEFLKELKREVKKYNKRYKLNKIKLLIKEKGGTSLKFVIFQKRRYVEYICKNKHKCIKRLDTFLIVQQNGKLCENICIKFFNELQSHPTEFIKSIFNFLGLEYVENINYKEKVLRGSRPLSPLLSRIIHKGSNLARSIKLENLVANLKYSKLSNLLYIPFQENNKPKITDDIKKTIIERTKYDTKQLEALFKKDLTDWLE